MRDMKRKLLISTLALLVLVGLGPATAGAAEVGASGQCYDQDGSGGQDQATVNDDPSVTIPTVTGAANAVIALTDDPAKVPDGDGCDRYDCDNDPSTHIESCDTDGDGTPDKVARKDYLEVHAEGGGEQAQACYDEEVHAGQTYNCPTSPTGPGGTTLPTPGAVDAASLLI